MKPGPEPTAYAAVEAYLFACKAHGTKFGIDRMRAGPRSSGIPSARLPHVHVAGTNGKGSVVAMLDAILHAAGWRTGMYTSPHLVHLGERVQVDRRMLTEAEIVAWFEELRPAGGTAAGASPDDAPGFFEFLTAMAFLQFARQPLRSRRDRGGHWAGGSMPPTSLTPEVSVITSIAMDHCEILGDTIEQIAGGKGRHRQTGAARGAGADAAGGGRGHPGGGPGARR
jgi:dihydrofolate synthase/folylpolyglutamate synthase